MAAKNDKPANTNTTEPADATVAAAAARAATRPERFSITEEGGKWTTDSTHAAYAAKQRGASVIDGKTGKAYEPFPAA